MTYAFAWTYIVGMYCAINFFAEMDSCEREGYRPLPPWFDGGPVWLTCIALWPLGVVAVMSAWLWNERQRRMRA